MSDETKRPAESAGGPFRIGSEAPVNPADSRCDAPWAGEWESRAQRRPRCTLPPDHTGPHSAQEAGFSGECRRYTWSDSGQERVEPC